jgi:glycerol-3-phosphate dehydrogenase
LWQAGPVVSVGTFDRSDALERLRRDEFDVLVVGGGITGAGVALDAASRGLRTALVERGDFASGTSSKSSKMIHGGIRYLQQHEVRLVYENLAERQRLLENAPHLVSPLPFLIPLFGRDGVVAKAVVRSYATALWLYDLTGGVRIGSRHRRVGRQEALEHLPKLRVDRLVAGFLYFDARADDARLTVAILRTAALDHGAAVVNYAGAESLVEDGTRVVGARIRPLDAEPLEVRARVVVNATGVWADEIEALEHAGRRATLRPAKGVHISVPASRLPADIAAVVPVAHDRRSIFVVPWPGVDRVYVGTTDTTYDGPLDDPPCTPEDVDYLLDAVNAVTTAELGRQDVTAVWAGLRPLLDPGGDHQVSARTADLSRRHAVRIAPSGLVTVTGGKLTTYRKMAEDAVDRALTVLGERTSGAHRRAPRPRSVTRRLRLRGAPDDRRSSGGEPSRDELEWSKVPSPLRTHLQSRYGTEARDVVELGRDRPGLLEPIVDGLPYVGAEVVYAARHEMARSLEDVLARRTRAVLQDAARAAAAAPAVASLLAEELGWDQTEAERRAGEFARATMNELERAGAGPPGDREARSGDDLARATPSRRS